MTIGEEGMGIRTLIGIPITIVIGIIPGIVVALLCRKYRNKPNATITPPEPSIKSTPTLSPSPEPPDDKTGTDWLIIGPIIGMSIILLIYSFFDD